MGSCVAPNAVCLLTWVKGLPLLQGQGLCAQLLWHSASLVPEARRQGSPSVGLSNQPHLPGTPLLLALKALCPQEPLSPGQSGRVGHPPLSQGQEGLPLPPSQLCPQHLAPLISPERAQTSGQQCCEPGHAHPRLRRQGNFLPSWGGDGETGPQLPGGRAGCPQGAPSSSAPTQQQCHSIHLSLSISCPLTGEACPNS